MLRYLTNTLSNTEIAAELYVSLSTVKTHERALYRKLGATGRRDAVRRARLLNQLDRHHKVDATQQVVQRLIRD